MNSRCAAFENAMAAALAGGIDDICRKRLDEHIAHCPSCRRLFEELEDTWNGIEVPPPETSALRPVRLHYMNTSPAVRRFPFARAAAVAAALILGALLFRLYPEHTDSGKTAHRAPARESVAGLSSQPAPVRTPVPAAATAATTTSHAETGKNQPVATAAAPGGRAGGGIHHGASFYRRNRPARTAARGSGAGEHAESDGRENTRGNHRTVYACEYFRGDAEERPFTDGRQVSAFVSLSSASDGNIHEGGEESGYIEYRDNGLCDPCNCSDPARLASYQCAM